MFDFERLKTAQCSRQLPLHKRLACLQNRDLPWIDGGHIGQRRLHAQPRPASEQLR